MLFIAFSLILSIDAWAADEWLILTEDLAPLNYIDNGRPVGPSCEIVQAISERMAVSSPITFYPWARAYKTALDTPNVALFSTTRTPQREALFKWVGPLAVKERIFFTKKGSGVSLATIEDAQSYSIGVLREGSSAQTLASYGFKQVEPTSTEQQNIQKLLAGRIDLWYTSKSTAVSVMSELGIELSALEQVLVVKKSMLYIAFNKQTPDETVAQWQKAYDALRHDGTVENIFKKYNLLFMYPGMED